MKREVVGRRLILAGLGLLALWPWSPRLLAATVMYHNVGSILLNRALLAPERTPEERVSLATQAGHSFYAALTWDPLNGNAYYNLAAVYGLWQDTAEGSTPRLRVLSRAAALSPRDPNARFAFGQALAARGEHDRAIAEWRAAGAGVYFVNRGLALESAGDAVAALEEYRRATVVDPESAEGYYYLGRTLNGLDRQEEAIAALEAAAERSRTASPQRDLLLGEILAARGDRGAAVACFERALRFDATHLPARIALAQLFAAEGDCDAAADRLAPLLAADAGRFHALLGRCLLESRRYDEAIPYLERALALAPASVPHHLTLAQAYALAGRFHDAIALYRRALELQPDNAEARRGLEELGWFEP